MSPDVFSGVCESLDVPMAVVTAFDGHERSGCLVGFHTQCSIEPRRWIVCISKENHTCRIAVKAEFIALHFLREDQHDLAELFGGTTADEIGAGAKFEHCAWQAGAGGTPILAGCDFVTGRVLERTDAGDHVAHVLEITEAGRAHKPARQLGSQAVHDIQPGHPA